MSGVPPALWPVVLGEAADPREGAGVGMCIHPGDRQAGALMIGSQGSGKTSALLRTYLNDIEDPNAAVIVIDPKSELVQLCLQHTPIDCPKRVWYLNMGRPRFGMTPLALVGSEPLADQASQIAEVFIHALLDTAPGQIFQSSSRYLHHAVYGAIAIARANGWEKPRINDIYDLLRPRDAKNIRPAAAHACSLLPGFDQAADFFSVELPDELAINQGGTAQRMDPPRNKVDLLRIPQLRRFFDHPTDLQLSEIITERDILLVDANMATIGTEHSQAMMFFILWMLNRHLQHQVQRPQGERPRVAMTIDEAHYVTTRNLIKQIAFHRAAGLDVTMATQFLSQLGAGDEYEREIREGVVNLMQSQFLFRMGDPKQAEQFTRAAMAVYTSKIGADPEERAQVRISPETLLNLKSHHCVCSWIANGERASSFLGQTYPFRQIKGDAKLHMARMESRVGPYPELLDAPQPIGELKDVSGAPSPERAPEPERADGAEVKAAPAAESAPKAPVQPPVADPAPPAPLPEGLEPLHFDDDAPPAQPDPPEQPPGEPVEAKRERSLPTITPTRERPRLDESPVLRIVGRPQPQQALLDEPRPGEQAGGEVLLQVDLLSQIASVGEPEQATGETKTPRMYDTDWAILAQLDKTPMIPRETVGRLCLSHQADRAQQKRIRKLFDGGLLCRCTTTVPGLHGTPPILYRLSEAGFGAMQERGLISAERKWEEPQITKGNNIAHDTAVAEWVGALRELLGRHDDDYWRTPRDARGRFTLPWVQEGRRKRPLVQRDILTEHGEATIGIFDEAFADIRPDSLLAVKIRSQDLSFDLAIEMNRMVRLDHWAHKLTAYDAFLTSWHRALDRYRDNRPAAVWIYKDQPTMEKAMRQADELLVGRRGWPGSAPEEWYYPARRHMFFTYEALIYSGSLAAWSLPALPPPEREKAGQPGEPQFTAVDLLPATILKR